MHSYEGSTEAAATADVAFATWTDVSRWTEGEVVERAQLSGPFTVGSTIAVKIAGFPPSRTTITRIEGPGLWESEAKMPGVTLRYEHVIDEVAGGVRITERANLSGPLAGPVGALIGRRLTALFGETTAQVARQAVAAPQDI